MKPKQQAVVGSGNVCDPLAAETDDTSKSSSKKAAEPLVPITDRTSNVEAMILGYIAEHSLPLSLAPHIVSLAQELSRDYKALQELRLERTSATCKLKEGLSAVFHKRLVSDMKNTPFSVNIDESTLKANKARVLNIMVCYFCEETQRSVTYLYASVEMSVVNADTVYSTVLNKFREDDISLDNLVSVLSDSAAYMRGCKTGFQTKLKETVPKLLDIDGDVCHHLHNIVKNFMSHVDPDRYLERLLGDVHRDFALSADLREDLCNIASLLQKKSLLPMEFAGHRWMSIMDTSARLLNILEQVTVFYFAWLPHDQKEEHSSLVTGIIKTIPAVKRSQIYSLWRKLKSKNLTPYGKARKARIVNKLFSNRSKTLFLCNLVKSVTPLFKNCILSLEKSTPQVHKLYDKILEAFTQFLACYVKPEILDTPRCAVKDLDLSCEENYLPPKQMTVGSECSSLLKKMPDSDK